MTDDELRRKLFWHQLGELLLVAVCAGIIGYWSIQLLASAVQDGQITLYAGGRSGPKTPVTLSIEELPFGVVGAVLIFLSFSIGLLRLISNPAYHVLRTGVPRLALPRVPRSTWMQRFMGTHFGVVVALGALGAILVFLQYATIALR